MRKLVRILVPAALLLSTAVPAAAQEVAQPSQGAHSDVRAPQGVGVVPTATWSWRQASTPRSRPSP